MTELKKKRVRDCRSLTNDNIFDGKLRDVISRLKELSKTYPDGELNVCLEYDWGDPYVHAMLYYTREETDEELAKRVKAAKYRSKNRERVKQRQEEKKRLKEAEEKEELKRLLEKYGTP